MKVGDRAIDQVVSAFAAVRTTKACEFRIEHAQLISETTARTSKDLGIILSMQPNFSEDSVIYESRLPEGYAERNNPFRMLIDKAGFTPGVDLLFGSDGMPHGFQYGLQQALFPSGSCSNQILTLNEFTASYCLNDDQFGHIEIDIDPTERQISGKVILKAAVK